MKRHSLSKSFVLNLILTGSSVFFPLLTFPYVSRILMPSGTGQVDFAVSVVSYFITLAMLGLPTYGVRAIAQTKSDPKKMKRTALQLMELNLITTLVSFLLFLALMMLWPKLAAQKGLMLVVSMGIWLNSFSSLWFFQGLEEYGYITGVSMAFKALSLVTMILFVKSPSDTIWYGVMSVLSAYGSGLVSLYAIHKRLGHFEWVPIEWGIHLKPLLVFFMVSVATTIYTHLDTVMLGIMKDNWQVGLYSASIKIKVLLTTLITSLGTVLLPRLSEYAADQRTELFENLLSKAVNFTLLAALPLCIYSIVFAKDILTFICGADYASAALCMQLLMPTVLFIGLSNITGIQILVPTGKEKQLNRSVIIGALVDLVLNLCLIPSLSIVGAAIGTLCAEIAVLLVQSAMLKDMVRRLIGHVELKSLVLEGLASLGLCVLFAFTAIDSIFLKLAAAGSVMLLMCIFILWMTKESIFMSFMEKFRAKAGKNA